MFPFAVVSSSVNSENPSIKCLYLIDILAQAKVLEDMFSASHPHRTSSLRILNEPLQLGGNPIRVLRRNKNTRTAIHYDLSQSADAGSDNGYLHRHRFDRRHPEGFAL
jgi:hypothetical protein